MFTIGVRDPDAEVETRIRSVLRGYDVVVPAPSTEGASGVTFLVLCEDIAHADHAASIGSRLAATVGGDGRSAVGGPAATIGADLFDAAPGSAIANAISAMSRAAETEHGFAFFDRTYARAAHAAVEMDLGLRRALETGGLTVHFQPKVELGSSRLVAFEALVRWPQADGTWIPPAEFIPVAERTGMIEELGAWVLEASCRQLLTWRTAGQLPDYAAMCVNVSARQFTALLAEQVREIIDRTGIEPDCLVLEVTESVVMADVDAAVETLRALKQVGVLVSVDDFGTGYSSLAYLKRLPLDELKIDQAFVGGLGRDPEDTAIVGAVVALGHALDLTVIAEGVETEQQALTLESLGCDVAQGYHYARPQAAEQLADLLVPPFVIVGGGASNDEPGRRPDLVLVADDAPDVRQLATVSLTTAGFEVREATTGTEAVKTAALARPDCVLLDLAMPGLGGIDTCRALRADPTTANCAIVILTSRETADDKIAAFSAGADDYIIKPFSPRDLVGRVRSAIRRRTVENHAG